MYPDRAGRIRTTGQRELATRGLGQDERVSTWSDNEKIVDISDDSPELHVDLENVHRSLPEISEDLNQLTAPTQLDWLDKDDLHVIESCDFYNNVVVSDIAPAHAPFKRVKIPVDIWRHHVPKMLQHVWIALMKSMQASKAGVDPVTVRELCHYRGSGIKALRESLPEAANDPYGMVLSCVMTMMTADLYTGGPWTSHLEAARRIMILNGGFKSCFDRIQDLRRLLVNYVVADVFSATMFNSRLIDKACSDMHAEYIEVLQESDYDVFACSRPCPGPIIQAIARINVLRASLNQVSGRKSEELASEIQDTFFFIDEFDATAWAIEVLDFDKVLPQRAEECPAERDVAALISCASCYHSATLLYFLLSCTLPLSPRDKLRVHLASQNLSQHVRLLFESASTDSEGPLHSQPWKLLSWPILIGLYVRLGWDIGEESVDTCIERRQRIANVLPAARTLDVMRFVRRVEAQRARRSAAEWTWDDGFYSRCAFAL